MKKKDKGKVIYDACVIECGGDYSDSEFCLVGHQIITDDAFSTGTGLEHVGLLSRSAGSGRWTPLQKQETKKDRRGLARCLSDA